MVVKVFQHKGCFLQMDIFCSNTGDMYLFQGPIASWKVLEFYYDFSSTENSWKNYVHPGKSWKLRHFIICRNRMFKIIKAKQMAAKLESNNIHAGSWVNIKWIWKALSDWLLVNWGSAWPMRSLVSKMMSVTPNNNNMAVPIEHCIISHVNKRWIIMDPYILLQGSFFFLNHKDNNGYTNYIWIKKQSYR